MPRIIDPEKIGLPPRPFLYTIDQIASILSMRESVVHQRHIYHEGRDIGRRSPHEMLAHNIAPPNDKPDWRVSEQELLRWMRLKGFKYYDSGTVVK